jgi:hypothetical protein
MELSNKKEGGTKNDAGKRSWHLLPIGAIEEVLQVLEFGAAKYSAYNWTKGFAWTRLISAAFRHLTAFLKGEDKDPESGHSHLAHAVCCLLFLLTFVQRKLGEDDRFVFPEVPAPMKGPLPSYTDDRESMTWELKEKYSKQFTDLGGY